MGFNFESIFIVIFAIAAGYFLVSIVKNKGLKGAILGGKVKTTLGEIELESKGLIKTKIKIHSIEKNGKSNISLEIVHRSILSYQMVPVTMTKDEARQLIELMQRAMAET